MPSTPRVSWRQGQGAELGYSHSPGMSPRISAELDSQMTRLSVKVSSSVRRSLARVAARAAPVHGERTVRHANVN